MFTVLIIPSFVRSIIDWYFSLVRSSLLISIFSNSSIICFPWDSILEYIAISDGSFCGVFSIFDLHGLRFLQFHSSNLQGNNLFPRVDYVYSVTKCILCESDGLFLLLCNLISTFFDSFCSTFIS